VTHADPHVVSRRPIASLAPATNTLIGCPSRRSRQRATLGSGGIGLRRRRQLEPRLDEESSGSCWIEIEPLRAGKPSVVELTLAQDLPVEALSGRTHPALSPEHHDFSVVSRHDTRVRWRAE